MTLQTIRYCHQFIQFSHISHSFSTSLLGSGINSIRPFLLARALIVLLRLISSPPISISHHNITLGILRSLFLGLLNFLLQHLDIFLHVLGIFARLARVVGVGVFLHGVRRFCSGFCGWLWRGVGTAYGGFHVYALLSDRVVLGTHVFHADDVWAAGVRVLFGAVVHGFDGNVLRRVSENTFAPDGHCARSQKSSARSCLGDWDYARFLFLA